MNLPCLPKHAARPVALCETGSGSGYWLFFVTDRGIISGPYIPLAFEGKRFYRFPTDGRLLTVSWTAAGIAIETSYADGKPYRFTVEPGGRVSWQKW